MNKTFTIETTFKVRVINDPKSGRMCDFCHQLNREILIQGTNDDDRDICDTCIDQMGAHIKTIRDEKKENDVA